MNPVSNCKLLILALIAISLTSCASKKEDPDAAPKIKPYKYRDPVEQRVFYDGWFER